MQGAKSFEVSKQLVWEAYQKVKANQGAAGVDRISLLEFEKNLKDNLYKIWNRLSSGSYLPPPVKLVETPKAGGKTQPLGIPTVGDRVAQRSVKITRAEGTPCRGHLFVKVCILQRQNMAHLLQKIPTFQKRM